MLARCHPSTGVRERESLQAQLTQTKWIYLSFMKTKKKVSDESLHRDSCSSSFIVCWALIPICTSLLGVSKELSGWVRTAGRCFLPQTFQPDETLLFQEDPHRHEDMLSQKLNIELMYIYTHIYIKYMDLQGQRDGLLNNFDLDFGLP